MIIRKMSKKGVLTIPKKFRDQLGWSGGEKLIIELYSDGKILLKSKRSKTNDKKKNLAANRIKIDCGSGNK